MATQSMIGALRVSLGLDSAAFMTGTRQATSAMANMGRRMRNLGAGASAMGAAFVLAMRGQLKTADEAIKAAQTMGLSVEQYTRLGHAANLSGVSMGGMQTAVQKMAQAMVDTPALFEDLGIAVRDADGNLRGTDAVLLDFADAIAALPDGAEKIDLMRDALGRSGTDMIPMLNGGRAALVEMMAEADRLNLTIGTDTARAAELFNDNITRMTGQMGGLTNQITQALAPVLAEISTIVVDLAQRFGELDPQTRKFIATLGVGLAVGGPILLGLGLLVTGVKLLISPFALAVAGAAALATAGVAIYQNWDGIKEFFANRVATITEWARDLPRKMAEGIAANNAELLAAITGLWDLIWTEVSSWPRKMAQAGRDLLNGLTDGIFGGRANAERAAADMANSITDIVNGEFGIQSPSRVFRAIGKFLTEGLALGIREGAPEATGAMASLAQTVGDTLDQTDARLDKFAQGFASFAGPVLRRIQTLRGAFANMATSIGNSLFNAGLTQLGGWIGGLLGLGGARAMGGPVSAGKTYLVGERGPELFTPPRSGTIVPNHALGQGGGGTIRLFVEAVEGAMFSPRVRAEAQGVAVQVVQGYDRQLPDRMAAIQNDPKLRG